MKCKVKLTFQYSDVVYVEAGSEKEAIQKALTECNEQYESFSDAHVTIEDIDSIDDLKMVIDSLDVQ